MNDYRKMNPLLAGGIAQANFEAFMAECQPWRKTCSTFAMDFAIADAFGIEAVRDTFNRAFNEWKANPEMMGEMCIALSQSATRYYGIDRDYYETYMKLYEEADTWCLDNYKDEDFRTWYEIVD